MTELTMDPIFASTIREALVAEVNKSRPPLWRRRRFWIGGLTIAGVLGASAGAATAGLLLLPGAPQLVALGEAVEGQGVGPGSVELGAAPESATSIGLEIWCVTAGTFTFNDGSTFSCAVTEVGQGVTLTMPLSAGEHAVTIDTEVGGGWRISAAYVNSTTTPWAVNGRGDSYGVANESGSPDLLAVETTDGQLGYVYADELAEADGTAAAEGFTSPEEALEWQQSMAGKRIIVPVYAHDGITKIGDFVVQH